MGYANQSEPGLSPQSKSIVSFNQQHLLAQQTAISNARVYSKADAVWWRSPSSTPQGRAGTSPLLLRCTTPQCAARCTSLAIHCGIETRPLVSQDGEQNNSLWQNNLHSTMTACCEVISVRLVVIYWMVLLSPPVTSLRKILPDSCAIMALGYFAVHTSQNASQLSALAGIFSQASQDILCWLYAPSLTSCCCEHDSKAQTIVLNLCTPLCTPTHHKSAAIAYARQMACALPTMRPTDVRNMEAAGLPLLWSTSVGLG